MKQYHKTIFFTKSPLSGYYKFEEIFQIYPADLENMPTIDAFREYHFPNVLEYWTSDDEIVTIPAAFEGLEEMHTLTARRKRKETQVLDLLSAFSNNLFFSYSSIDGAWGFPVGQGRSGEEVNTQSSSWCFHMYFFPDLPRQLRIDGFTSYQGNGIEMADYDTFYTHYPNLDNNRDEPIIFPSVMNELIHAYYSLDTKTQSSIDFAISYTVSAVSLHYSNKTLSILSSFTSLETLVDLEYSGQKVEKCDTCGQPRFKVASKFRDFLLKYIGNTDENKKKFNTYYSFRSKVIHTGRQLATEKLFAEVSEDVASKELTTRIEILQLGKMALTRWLLINS